MPYYPKNKILIKTTLDNEFVYKSNSQSYTGNYIETSTGKYFAGTSNTNVGPELIKNPSIDKEFNNKFGALKQTKKFNINKEEIKNYLKKTQPIPTSKSIPTEKDYNRGFYNRYFSKRINGGFYIEISKKIYDSIRSKEGKYDHNLHQIGNIVWYIKGNDVHRLNSLSIKSTQIRHKNIFYLFPILNEFLQPTTSVIENLIANSGELYYSGGKEYTGAYHKHPLKGPMVGATHTTTSHDSLYYFNQLPELPNTSYEDFLAGYNKITCYKCIDNTVLSIQRSRLLGCPKNSTTNYEIAAYSCFGVNRNDINNLSVEGDIINIETGTGKSNNFSNNRPNTPTPTNSISNFNTRPWYEGYGSLINTYTCFTPNTLITMANGEEKPISSVKKGEKVKSEIGESTILSTQIHEGDFKVYSINEGKPFVTEDHPFKTIDGWKAINPFYTLEKHQIYSKTLNLDDIIYKIKGKEVVKNIKEGKTTYKKVYNLSLDNEHVYYANGYLVHNDKINTV